MKETSKLNLIYIASTGRSGSTLLEMLLGSLLNVWTLGELYVLPWELKKNGRCGCGKKFKKCEYWAPIILNQERILYTGGNIDRFRDDYSISKFFRYRHLVDLFINKKVSDQKGLQDFCHENRKLLSAINERAHEYKNAEISYIVDSSKVFYRLFWLLHCDSISLKVVHIVKDPHSFVHSKIKNLENSADKLYVTLRMSLRYMVENWIIERIKSKLDNKNIWLVRYEDLAAHPEKTMGEIASWLDLKCKPDRIFNFRSYKNHGVAGNIMRHGSDDIYLDEKWRVKMGSLYKTIVSCLTHFSAKRYFYS